MKSSDLIASVFHVALPIAEHKQIAVEGVEAYGLFHQQRQPADGLTHVCDACGQKYPCERQREVCLRKEAVTRPLSV